MGWKICIGHIEFITLPEPLSIDCCMVGKTMKGISNEDSSAV